MIDRIRKKFEYGQDIFRRPTVAAVIAHIEKLESTKKLRDGESFGTYINRRIEEIFNDLAGEAGEMLTKTMLPEDIPAGALAFELMAKSFKLQEAWKEITEEDDEQNASDPV